MYVHADANTAPGLGAIVTDDRSEASKNKETRQIVCCPAVINHIPDTCKIFLLNPI